VAENCTRQIKLRSSFSFYFLPKSLPFSLSLFQHLHTENLIYEVSYLPEGCHEFRAEDLEQLMIMYHEKYHNNSYMMMMMMMIATDISLQDEKSGMFQVIKINYM
jgi:hypothetical protein